MLDIANQDPSGLPPIHRPFRFLARITGALTRGPLLDEGRRAEAMGYSTLVVSDHLRPQLAPTSALAAIASVTETIRIGTFVLNSDFRHPAVLAQELASLDVISGGRLEIGLGAGWNGDEYREAGMAFEHLAVRHARLEETITILEGLFADGPFTFEGVHYKIRGLDGHPKPVQRPRPPFLLGGGGRAILELAARYADIVSLSARRLNGHWDIRSCLGPATEQKIEWIRSVAGDRFKGLELNTYPVPYPLIVTDHARREAAGLAARIAREGASRASVDELLESPHVFIGSIDNLVDKIRELRRRFGISSVMLGDIDQAPEIVARLAGS